MVSSTFLKYPNSSSTCGMFSAAHEVSCKVSQASKQGDEEANPIFNQGGPIPECAFPGVGETK